MKNKMMVVVYVDNTIITGLDVKAINNLISDLGISPDNEDCETFMLGDEGKVGDFLGICLEKAADNSIILTQTGLINKVIQASGMADCNTAITPASTTPLGFDTDGAQFDEKWEFAEVMGMLMFLATNSRPGIACAVHQCARFMHNTRNSHATAVKCIILYVKGTWDKGMYLSPTKELKVDCYIDANFAGLWKTEDDQDPLSIKSHSG